VRGDEPLKIQRAGGHDDLATTQIYINEAQTFDAGFGEVFPTLDLDLFSSLSGFEIGSEFRVPPPHVHSGKRADQWRPQGDSNNQARAILAYFSALGEKEYALPLACVPAPRRARRRST
jgi:hypothetical protein